MTTIEAFLLNIGLNSILPLYFATINPQLRAVAFYIYMGILLLGGGILGAIYSFPISENLYISGGNLAYGAFMMSAVMLIIVERDVRIFRNLMRLVVTVYSFMFLGLNFLAWLLESGVVANPFGVPAAIFNTSLRVLVIGGFLVLSEILLLLFIFVQVRDRLSNPSVIAFIYTLAIILILCLDGALFPLLAVGLSPELVGIIYGNVTGKAIMGVCYSVPMLVFYLVFRRNFADFLKTTLTLKDLTWAPREELLEVLHQYEVQDQQLQRDKQELVEIVGRDELTDLANRRKFDQILQAQWSECQRAGDPLTLVLGDIDFFKQYNDSYGHPQGDSCLKQIGTLWGNTFNRPSDTAARVGGEEFAFILPNTSQEQVMLNLNGLMTRLHEQPIPHRASSIAPHVTMSIGVATCIPEKDVSPNKLFAVADERLYKAKNAGRNRIVAE